ncbi:MAG: methyltransferase domain-containing protein [Mycobacteriales bacterium]
MTAALVNVEQARSWDGDEGTQWTLHEERYDSATAAHSVHLLRAAAIQPDDSVLDIGCGCGATTRQAGGFASQGHALGVDLSREMLVRATQRASDDGLANVSFVQADAQVHPFEPASFDVAISKYGAMFFADPVAAFTNIAAAVRPGGRLALLTWQEFNANPWITRIRAALAAGRELPEPPANAPGPFGLAGPDHVRDVLGQTGWGALQLTEISGTVRFGDDPDDAFDFVSKMGLSQGLLDGLDPAVRDQAMQRLHATLAEAMSDAGVTFASTSWLVEARRD